MAQEYNLEIEYIHFPLHPETPPEGVALLDLFGGPSAAPRLEAAQKRLGDMAKAEGLPMTTNRTMTYNSRLAQELGAWATSEQRGTQFHDAVFRAYFVDNKDVSELSVLADCAKTAGLDPNAARKVMTERTFQVAVDADWQRSRQAGVTGVPTFAIGGQQVVGAQPYAVLQQLVESAGVKKRN